MDRLPHDISILKQVAKGDEKAFRLLIDRYADFLFTYINGLVKDQERSEELVQDIFLQIWQTREALGRIHNFKSYIFILSRNQAINAVKKMLYEKKQMKEFVRLADIEPVIVDEARLSLVEEAIEQLPPQQYKVWVMSRRQGKKYSQIADELELSRETVKKYLQRATETIRHYVEKHLEILAILFWYGR